MGRDIVFSFLGSKRLVSLFLVGKILVPSISGEKLRMFPLFLAGKVFVPPISGENESCSPVPGGQDPCSPYFW